LPWNGIHCSAGWVTLVTRVRVLLRPAGVLGRDVWGRGKPESMKHGWRVNLLLAVAATVATLGVVAGLGEWAVRYRERTRTSVPGTMSKLFYRHSRLMHALVRGTDYYGWVHIGRQGFRGAREVTLTPSDSVFRIIVVGGSTTFDGFTSGDSAAWPARLEQVLDSVAAPQRFEVLNAGVPGFEVFDDLVRLELELHWYDPDLIILYQGHNNLFNTLATAGRSSGTGFDARPGEIPAVPPWQVWLERHSLLYHKLRERLKAVRFRSAGADLRQRTASARYEAALSDGAQKFSRDVRMFVAAAQSLGVRVMIPQIVYAARFPVGGTTSANAQVRWRAGFPFAPTDVVWAGYARYDSVARAEAARAGAVYVPASDSTLWLVDGYAGDDPIHFNNRGAWRMAGHLARAIRTMVPVGPASTSGPPSTSR
jgi:lysophospholipase L1-like esterase